MSAILEVKKLSKSFGDIKALENVSFSVDKGEFVFLTGTSGAGKTTLLRTILKDLTPDSGEIVFDGEELSKIKRRKVPYLRRKIGVVFQDFKVLSERTVTENAEVALAVSGIPKKEWRERVNAVLKLVGLRERSEMFPSQLSGGELQRVSLARALVVNPKMILADEPTGNLDWDTAASIIDLLDKINKDGKTIIVATHHKVLVKKMKRRVIEIEGGKMSDLPAEKKKENTSTPQPAKPTKAEEKESEEK